MAVMHSQTLADFTGTDITTESFESQIDKITLANNKNAGFKEYLNHLKSGERLPRGKFFVGKKFKRKPIFDEAHLFLSGN